MLENGGDAVTEIELNPLEVGTRLGARAGMFEYLGLKPDDILLSANASPVKNVDGLVQAFGAIEDRTLMLMVQRAGRPLSMQYVADSFRFSGSPRATQGPSFFRVRSILESKRIAAGVLEVELRLIEASPYSERNVITRYFPRLLLALLLSTGSGGSLASAQEHDAGVPYAPVEQAASPSSHAF